MRSHTAEHPTCNKKPLHTSLAGICKDLTTHFTFQLRFAFICLIRNFNGATFLFFFTANKPPTASPIEVLSISNRGKADKCNAREKDGVEVSYIYSYSL